MYLLDEAVDVWRPVSADKMGDGRYQVIGPVPEAELWEFPPGTLVRAKLKSLSSGVVLVAVADADD